MADPDSIPMRRMSHRDMHAAKAGDDIAVRRARPEAEPFKRKKDTKSGSSSLRSGRELQEALATSASGLSLDGFGEEERMPKVPVETQVAILEPYQPTAGEDVAKYAQVVSSQAEVYRQIFMQARRLNYNISDLEVVFVGQRNQGKSNLLQAVLGFPLPLSRTRRTFQCHLVNIPSLDKPRFLIKEQSKETECTLEQLQTELNKRNRARTDAVTFLVEYKWGFDLTIIDTPAIKSLEEMASWARPAMTGTANRFLVAVESAKPVKDLQVLQWLKHFDPSFSRSMLVLTGFDQFLANFQANPRTALFHFEELENVPCFWTTLPTTELAKECGLDVALFQRRVWQHHQRDLDALRLLDLDYSRNHHQLGLYAFRQHLDSLFQTDLHRHIPSLSRAFEHAISHLEKSLDISKVAIEDWNTDNIRALATTYTSTWLRQMDSLLKGSLSGTPSKNGQTLEEEHNEFARWDSGIGNGNGSGFSGLSAGNTSTTSTPTPSVSVPHAGVKLYGAPQLLRLLEEFRIFASKCEMPTIESTEIIGSVDTAWAASEIARRKIETQFLPILEHLIGRAFFIMKRVHIVCDLVVEQRYSNKAPSNGHHQQHEHNRVAHNGTLGVGVNTAVTQKKFPAFSTFLRQSYIASQAQAQQLCLAKSKDEFCSSLTIYWELTDGVAPIDLTKDTNERMKHISQIAQNIYAKIKDRLIDAFILNVQTYFLAPTAVLHCSKAVAADVSTLNAVNIKDMFLVDQIKALHQRDIQTHDAELKALKELQTTFLTKLVPALSGTQK